MTKRPRSKRPEPEQAASATPRRQLGIAFALVVLTFAVFLPAYAYDYDRHEGWVWDDDDHYLNDPLIQADDGWWRIWLDPQPGLVGVHGGATVWNYWPLTRSSFWIERRLWGTDAHGKPNLLGSHVVNVALHACNALLVLLVLRQLRLPGAELAALLFAVHPVCVESVAWITQRKALLSTLFFLLALAGWNRFTAEGRARWYLCTCGAFLLALMAKTTTVMFPVVLVLLHGYARRPWTRQAVLRLAPLFAMSLIAGVTSILFERFIGSSGEAWSASVGERIATAGMIAWFYLGKLLLPIQLSFNYPRWRIDDTSVLSYLPSAALAIALALLWRLRRGPARVWLLALGCFLVNLFPVLGFLNVYGMRYAQVADHWQYLAAISIFALEAGLIVSAPRWIARARPPWAGAARLVTAVFCAVGLAALAASTWHESGAYVDRLTLWQHTLLRQPDSLIANNNVGTQLLDAGRPGEAIPYFRRVIAADPSFAEPHLNLGNALDSIGEREQAAAHWEQALKANPRQVMALHNLAVSRINSGRLAEAAELLERALAIEPRFDLALQKLARLYRHQGRPQAIRPFELRASLPAASAPVSGGRRIALAVWSAMALALAAGGAVAAHEARAAR